MPNVARGLLLLIALLSSASALAFDHAYTGYAGLLQRQVAWLPQGHASTVDYQGLQKEQAALRRELQQFSAVGRAEFEGWNRPRQMAFLINAYNAFTLELILSQYPDLQSIRDLGSLLRSPWKKSFFRLLGEERSLDWIEHEQLRPRYPDARIHFAVNCASIGCPALRPEPYLAERLEAQLDDQQRRFLSDRSRNRFDAATGTLNVSMIFKWYGEDFSTPAGGTEAWLASRSALLADTPAEQARIASGAFKLGYQPYDWRLNDRRPPGR